MATISRKQAASDCTKVRSRSFGGCTTCRTRHVKCDEAKPICSTCSQLGLICGGYEKDIFFGNGPNFDHGLLRFRRPLLTEEERGKMSDWLTTVVPPNKTVKILSQIEVECEQVKTNDELQITRGPFGVFRIGHDEGAILHACIANHISDSEQIQTFEQLDEELFIPYEDVALSEIRSVQQSSFLPIDQDIDLLSPTLFSVENGSNVLQQSTNDETLNILHDYAIDQAAQVTIQNTTGICFDQSLVLDTFPQFISSGYKVPEYTVILLKHYTTVVVNSMTACTHSKTPWHILFLPHAKECLAALTLGEDLNHANLSSLYGILAVSAFSLGGIFHSDMWLECGKRYKQKARENIKMMLKNAYNETKVAKYKIILMALITMVQLSNFDGNRNQTECYLLEAEKFIRLKGLHRRKSRKVRLLHHCYAFTRIFHESTLIGNTNSLQRHHVRQAVETSGILIPGQDSMSFRHVGWIDLDREIMRMKNSDEGENDLHLEKPGIFSATLYHEIYGVPEEWMSLLSQVIRLGNEKDDAESCEIANPLSLKDFSSRTKALERCIINLQRTPQIVNVTNGHHVLDKMLNGMHSALAIYFYRRIYDLDASLLQEQVTNIRKCLEDCDETLSSVICCSAGFQWPAFIAACEVQSYDDQQWFSDWFKKCALHSGSSHLLDTLESLNYVWRERKCNGGATRTWLDLIRNNKLFQQHI